MSLSFKWVKKTGTYQTGESLFINKVRIGEYSWNSARTQGDSNDTIKWVGDISLPSLSDKARRIYASDEDEAKLKVEQVVTSWFNEIFREV